MSTSPEAISLASIATAINYTDSTHNVLSSNHAAVRAIRIIGKYFPVSMSETPQESPLPPVSSSSGPSASTPETSPEQASQAIRILSFQGSDEDERLERFIRQYLDRKDSLLTPEAKAYIVEKTRRDAPLDMNFDRVTLHGTTWFLPLRGAFGAVLMAMQDTDPACWAVEAESVRERLDELDRINNALAHRNLCSTGVRHSWIAALDGYEGESLVMEENELIVREIRHAVNEVIREQWGNLGADGRDAAGAELPRFEAAFTACFMPWILEGKMPEALLDAIVGKAEGYGGLIARIHRRFIETGNVPSESLQAKIRGYTSRAAFKALSCDLTPFLATVSQWRAKHAQKFLQHAAASPANPKEKLTVDTLSWLRGLQSTPPSGDVMASFYRINRLFDALGKYESHKLMLAYADFPAEYRTSMLKALQFMHNVSNGDADLQSVLANPDFETHLKQFEAGLSAFERDNHTIFMQEIFVRWFADLEDLATHGQILSVLFDMLMQEQTPEGNPCNEHPRIYVTGELLERWLPTDSDTPNVITLDHPWQINRVLLHALWYPVTTWTPRFAAALELTVRGIRNRFEEADTQNKQDLVSSSWPDSLLEECDWLLEDFRLSLTGQRAEKSRNDNHPIPLLPDGSISILKCLANAEPGVRDAVLEQVIRSPRFDVHARIGNDTPLRIAISAGNRKMVELLLERGADKTSMAEVALQNHQPEILRMLCESDWDRVKQEIIAYLGPQAGHKLYGYIHDDHDVLESRISTFVTMLSTLDGLPGAQRAELSGGILLGKNLHPRACEPIIQAIMQLDTDDRTRIAMTFARERPVFLCRMISAAPTRMQAWLETLDSPTLFTLMHTPDGAGNTMLLAAATTVWGTLPFWMAQMARIEPEQRALLLQQGAPNHALMSLASTRSDTPGQDAYSTTLAMERDILSLFISTLHFPQEIRSSFFGNSPHILMNCIQHKPQWVPFLVMILRDLPPEVRMDILYHKDSRGENSETLARKMPKTCRRVVQEALDDLASTDSSSPQYHIQRAMRDLMMIAGWVSPGERQARLDAFRTSLQLLDSLPVADMEAFLAGLLSSRTLVMAPDACEPVLEALSARLSPDKYHDILHNLSRERQVELLMYAPQSVHAWLASLSPEVLFDVLARIDEQGNYLDKFGDNLFTAAARLSPALILPLVEYAKQLSPEQTNTLLTHRNRGNALMLVMACPDADVDTRNKAVESLMSLVRQCPPERGAAVFGPVIPASVKGFDWVDYSRKEPVVVGYGANYHVLMMAAECNLPVFVAMLDWTDTLPLPLRKSLLFHCASESANSDGGMLDALHPLNPRHQFRFRKSLRTYYLNLLAAGQPDDETLFLAVETALGHMDQLHNDYDRKVTETEIAEIIEDVTRMLSFLMAATSRAETLAALINNKTHTRLATQKLVACLQKMTPEEQVTVFIEVRADRMQGMLADDRDAMVALLSAMKPQDLARAMTGKEILGTVMYECEDATASICFWLDLIKRLDTATQASILTETGSDGQSVLEKASTMFPEIVPDIEEAIRNAQATSTPGSSGGFFGAAQSKPPAHDKDDDVKPFPNPWSN